MRYVWSRLVIIFLLLQGVVFIINYGWGPRGICVLKELKAIKIAAQEDIQRLKTQNDDVRHQIDAWHNDIFFQEKYAREKLEMQKENEIIYFRE